MIQKILVPLDGSERAERALPVAARLARASGGTVLLVRAPSFSTSYGPALAPYLMVTPILIEDEQEEEKRYLSHVASLPVLAGIATETLQPPGDAASAILDVADAHQVDLIVLCSHGRTGLARWALGSVAEKVARHARAPVLVLRESGPIPSAPHPDPTSPFCVLVPLDGSVLAKAALEPAALVAAALSSPSHAALHLVRVVPPKQSIEGAIIDTTEGYERICHQARTYLEQTIQHIHEGVVAPRITAIPLSITCSAVVGEDVASTLIQVAEHGEEREAMGAPGRCDLIAMATHGRGGVQHWAMGSVTERVLHATRLPLLIVRPSASMPGVQEGHQQ